MIKSFGDKATFAVFNGGLGDKRWERFLRIVERKLKMVHAAVELTELRAPPGNHLEKLEGDREGQHSIRINDQWRVCFVWEDGNAYDVEICDYH